MDDWNLHCDTDGYCFGDLFADNSWICAVEHTNVSYPFPVWDDIYPGAPPLPESGKEVGGPACVSGMGSLSQYVINSEYETIYGGGGVFQTNGHQPRHTINNLVFTSQTADTMTTQHYQVCDAPTVLSRLRDARTHARTHTGACHGLLRLSVGRSSSGTSRTEARSWGTTVRATRSR